MLHVLGPYRSRPAWRACPWVAKSSLVTGAPAGVRHSKVGLVLLHLTLALLPLWPPPLALRCSHAIISSSMGPEYYVSIMSFVDKTQLEPGCSVLLHNKVRRRGQAMGGAWEGMRRPQCCWQLAPGGAMLWNRRA